MILSCDVVLKHDYIQTHYYLKLEQCSWVSKLHSMYVCTNENWVVWYRCVGQK